MRSPAGCSSGLACRPPARIGALPEPRDLVGVDELDDAQVIDYVHEQLASDIDRFHNEL